MAFPRARLAPDLSGAPFTVAEGRSAGLTRGQLRRTSLRAPTRGVRTDVLEPPPPDDVAGRCRELLPALPEDAVFCHATALALYGVDLPAGVDAAGPVHIQIGPGSTPPRRTGVRSHQRPASAIAVHRLVGGLRVLRPELVWVQLGAVLPVRELVVLGDALTRRKRPVSTPGALEVALSTVPPGTRGVRRLREAIQHVRARTDSPMESRLRWVLVDGGLPCPLVNHAVQAPDGLLAAMPDMAYPKQRVAVEYDGDVHRTSKAVWRRDIRRRQALEALGWRVITCTADDVLRTPDRALSWVRSALARA